MEQLKLDTRLAKRRGWIAQAEPENALEALPDVSHKIATPDETANPGPPASPEPPASE
jgi:hypothetical protein